MDNGPVAAAADFCDFFFFIRNQTISKVLPNLLAGS